MSVVLVNAGAWRDATKMAEKSSKGQKTQIASKNVGSAKKRLKSQWNVYFKHGVTHWKEEAIHNKIGQRRQYTMT